MSERSKVSRELVSHVSYPKWMVFMSYEDWSDLVARRIPSLDGIDASVQRSTVGDLRVPDHEDW